MDPMAPHIKRMVNRAAATLSRSVVIASGGQFPVRMHLHTDERGAAVVGTDSQKGLDMEFGGIDSPPTPWVAPALELAGMTLGGGHE